MEQPGGIVMQDSPDPVLGQNWAGPKRSSPGTCLFAFTFVALFTTALIPSHTGVGNVLSSGTVTEHPTGMSMHVGDPPGLRAMQNLLEVVERFIVFALDSASEKPLQIGVGTVLSRGMSMKQPAGMEMQLSPPPGDSPWQN